jgi:hypothetical protein
VRLEVGGETRTAELVVAADPRNRASRADLDAQYQHALRVWRRLSDVNEAVETIHGLRRQLDRWSSEDGELAAAAGSLREALTDVERELAPVDPKGSIRLGNPDRLDGKLRVLLAHAGFPARPTEASLAVAGELSRRLDGVLARLDSLLEGQVDEFNQLVRRMGAPALAPRHEAQKTGAGIAGSGDPAVPE